MRTEEEQRVGVEPMLLQRIERHMRRRRMSPTRFGREAIGDPNLLMQLRDGRELRVATAQRITDYLDDHECRQ